jgi:hypothetical protein
MPLTTGNPMRRSLWNIVAFCFSLMPVSCAMTDRPGATHLQHGGTLNERKSAAFPLRHISKLPARDPLSQASRPHDPPRPQTVAPNRYPDWPWPKGQANLRNPTMASFFVFLEAQRATRIPKSIGAPAPSTGSRAAPCASCSSDFRQERRVPRVWAVSPYRRPRQA